MAAFIRDKNARHNFRNKYKRQSKFRKLRDDNRRIFNEHKALKNELSEIKHYLWEIERVMFKEPKVKPLDNLPTVENKPVYISIVCIAKDEAPYIIEWIEYHKIIGVERFYFYDNGSSDNTKQLLEPYIKNGSVIYKFAPGDMMQLRCYEDAIYRYKNQTRWMALIDLDEFIVPVDRSDLKDLLKDYESFPGIAVNWVLFDSNGHDLKPVENNGLVTANYTRVMKNYNQGLNLHIKSIHDPRRISEIVSTHFAFYIHNASAVTENFEPTRLGIKTAKHSSNKIRINHYYTKSKEEYIRKVNKGDAAFIHRKYNGDVLEHKGETTEDYVIQRYLPQLKEAMDIK